MLKKCVAILDIGSSKVSALVGQRGVNNTLVIKSETSCEYVGFSEGEFFDVKQLAKAIENCVNHLKETLSTSINEVTVGVPGAFIRLENRKYKIVFNKPKKIKETDIETLLNAGQMLVETNKYKVISRSDIYFGLDGGIRVFNPVGAKSSMLGGYLNYALLEDYFSVTIRSILAKLKINKVNFVFDGLAESRFLLDRQTRESACLLIDCGYITSTASLILGNGIIAKHSEDFGGGIFSYHIFKECETSSHDVAESIKRMVNLTIKDAENLNYKVENKNGGIEEYPVEKVNDIIIENLDEYLENVASFLMENSKKIKNSPKVFLTGGGLCYIRGAREYVQAKLGLPVETVKPRTPLYGAAEESSAFAVLDYALSREGF